jgi:hypothetical protein
VPEGWPVQEALAEVEGAEVEAVPAGREAPGEREVRGDQEAVAARAVRVEAAAAEAAEAEAAHLQWVNS